jgi:hypothetical protein
MNKEKIYKFYVRSRNFFVNNFFVNILCIKQNDTFIYLNDCNIIYRYLLLLIPFYFLKITFNLFDCELIYKIDGIYGITNIKKNHIIPFITHCVISNDDLSLNITNDIRFYNSSIPISFYINNNKINNFYKIQLVYYIKSNRNEKKIDLRDFDLNNYLIYQLFE